MPSLKPGNINEYIAQFPAGTQKFLKQIRAAIKKAAPKAKETISYSIPAFSLNGHYLIYFAGFNNHIGLYPAPRGAEEFKKELTSYKGGKGTVQFPLDQPMPVSLITRIVRFKAGEILLKAEKKRSEEASA